jgi:anti-sigma-K factor RskA
MHDLDDQSVKYLLGELSPEDRRAVEERLMTDGEAFELMQATEAELYFAYARGTLDGARRKRFEERYLGTAEERERLVRAKALVERAAAEPTSAGARGGRRSFWRRPLAVLGLVVAVAAGVSIALFARVRTGGQRGDRVLVVTLVAATRSPGAPTVAVGPEIGTVRLEIDPGDEDWTGYIARLVDARGAVVVEPRRLERPVLDVPASRLGPGQWEVVLDGVASGDRIEAIGRFAFIVTP